MSTNKILQGGLIAAFSIAGLSTTADAQSRYGNVYDYESGRNCGSACAPAQIQTSSSSRYGSSSQYGAHSIPVSPGPVYVDCRATGTCAPQPQAVYAPPQPQTVYTQPQTYVAPTQTYTQSYQAPTYQAQAQQLPAECPAGTTPQSDGTCMESSYSSTSSYSSSSSYSEPSSYSSSSYSSSTTAPANCPSGTTAQSDGTCMETSGSSYSSYDSGSSYGSGSSYSGSSSSSSYGSGSSYSGGTPTNCPSGTTAQSDGTCMEGGSSSYSNAYTGSSVELFTGDASASTPSYGYSSDGSYGSANDYLPIRK